MNFSEIEENIYKIASFLDGNETEVPIFDFALELKRLEKELIIKSNFNYENYSRFHKLITILYDLDKDLTFNKNRKPNFKVFDKVKFEQLILMLSDISRKELPHYERFIFKNFPELDYKVNNKSVLRNIHNFLNEKTPFIDNSEVEKTPKLIWKGTPGEFGGIFDELINKGYLTRIRNLKYTVEILGKTFEIRNDSGKIVDTNYLYKCFGEKKKKYTAQELTLIESDNYSN